MQEYSYAKFTEENEPLKITESFKYSDIGNPEIYRGKKLSWSHSRQLDLYDYTENEDGSKTAFAEYTYNANGIRTSKRVNDIETYFYLNGTKVIAQTDTNNNTLYFHYGCDGVTSFEHNGTTYIYKKNVQNDIIGIYDINGQEIVKYVYDAWGNHKTYVLNNSSYVDINENSSYTESRLINKTIAELNPFRYRSYYYDIETNLYYLNSRYYDSELGRFINADDISVLDISNVALNGLNLYCYCLNNPVNEVDENGYLLGFLIGLLVAGAVGAIVGATSYTASVLIKGITTGKWEWNWANFIGDTLGGFIGGMFSIIPGVGTYISAFVTGLASTILTDAFSSIIYGTEFNILNSLGNGIVNGLLSTMFVGIVNTKNALKGLTYGRGSWNAISNQIYTKFRRDIIKKIRLKTFGKMLGLSFYLSSIDIFKKIFA